MNNYNPEFLLAWNANIDVQFCADPYAVTSYMTDYITKADAGLTKLLQDAVKESKDFDDFQRLLHLKQVYMTHRQVSASEAVYRLFRHLQMKCSTVKTIFVSTNFPEERSSFYGKVQASNNDDEEMAQSDDEGEANIDTGDNQIVSITGYKGKFRKAESIHEKYALRPLELEDLCLAQFATTYEPCRKKNLKLEGNVSEEKIELCHFITWEHLPKFIRLQNGKIMEARTKMKVLRLHSVRNKVGHEENFAKMLLYLHWRNEKGDLQYENPELCNQIYEEKKAIIKESHDAMLPYSKLKEDIEAMAKNEERAIHAYENINGIVEQENLENAIEEVRQAYISINIDFKKIMCCK